MTANTGLNTIISWVVNLNDNKNHPFIANILVEASIDS